MVAPEPVQIVLTAVLTGLAMVGSALAFFYRMGLTTGEAKGAADEGGGEPDAVNQWVDDLRDYLDTKFETIDTRFMTMQDQLDRRFTHVEGQIEGLDEDLERVEGRLNELHTDK